MKKITTLFSFLLAFLLYTAESQAQCNSYYQQTSTVNYYTPTANNTYTLTPTQKVRGTQTPVQYVTSTETITYVTRDSDRVLYDSAAKSRSGTKAAEYIVLESKSMIREPINRSSKTHSGSINQPRVIKNNRVGTTQHTPPAPSPTTPPSGGNSKRRG